MIDTNILNLAAFEAIFWWNKDEHHYHYYFSNYKELVKNQYYRDYFTISIYHDFLKSYSIRRNVPSGIDSVKVLAKELFEGEFFDAVRNGNKNIIDHTSNNLKNNNIVKNNVISLLSKTASMINPMDFSLYDTLALKGLRILKNKSDRFSSYKIKNYIDYVNLIDQIISHNKDSFKLLENISSFNIQSKAVLYFKSNKDAYCRRILDKYLILSLNDNQFLEINLNYYKNLQKI